MTHAQTIESPRRTAPLGSSLKTIVVATDFSEEAAAALEWTVKLARAHAAQIVLVHAIDTELPALAEAQGPIGVQVRDKLEELKLLIAGRVPAQTEYDLGKPWSVIARVAAEAHADLIVVGAHGRSTLSERLLGTVADRLIRTASTPVVVHRDGRSRVAPGIRTVLAATDFSEEAALAVHTAVRLLGASGEPGRLVLFYTVAVPIDYAGVNVPPLREYWEEAERTAAGQLESLAAAVRSDRLQVEVKTVRGDPAKEIVHEAESINADLIALGTVGRSGLGRLFMGSVAERVLHHAQCPVLAVRRADAGEPARLTAE